MEFEPTAEDANLLISPEEKCLIALFDLKESIKYSSRHQVSSYYNIYTDSIAPDSLTTRMVVDTSSYPDRRVDGVDDRDVAASLYIEFEDSEAKLRLQVYLDFLNRDEGLQIFIKKPRFDDNQSYVYTKRLSKNEVEAIEQDATNSRNIIIEEEAELLKLGTLALEADNDGSRLFHIGDILSVTTGRMLSPRGMEGYYDLLDFVTNDHALTTQLPRFAEECKPEIERQLGEIIKPFQNVPTNLKGRLKLYRWLNGVVEELGGTAFLRLEKMQENIHAIFDPMDELELDFGSDIHNKIIKIDTDTDSFPEE